MKLRVLYLVGKVLIGTIRLWPERHKSPKKIRGRIGFENRTFKLPVFTPNLAQLSQKILIILIARKLPSTVYFQKIYSLSILVPVLLEL
jgi:hypothetical protein